LLSSPAAASSSSSDLSSQAMLISPGQAPAATAAKAKKEKEPANIEPLTLEEERQLRVRRSSQTDSQQQRHSDSNSDSCPSAFAARPLCLVLILRRSSCPSALLCPVQLHYSIQLTQMATILNLPLQVTVSRPAQHGTSATTGPDRTGPSWRASPEMEMGWKGNANANRCAGDFLMRIRPSLPFLLCLCVAVAIRQHTAIIFFKRFYLHESVMEYSPKDVA